MDVRKLASGDHDAWRSWIEPIITDEETALDPRLVQQMLRVAPHDRWFELCAEVIEADDRHFTKSGPRRQFERWFVRSALERSKLDNERLWPLRKYALTHLPGHDGGYADARALYDVQKGKVPSAELAETAIMVAKGAMTSGEWADARTFATEAVELFEDVGDEASAAIAARRLGGALLHLGEFADALGVLHKPMMTRGPLFGGGGTSVHRSWDDPFVEAVSEAATIATWATYATPEWIRALGGIAERAPNETVSNYIWDYLDASLPVAFEAWNNPESDIEVVVRHSGQRNLVETPLRVLKAYVKAWPHDGWAHQQIEVIGEFQRIDELRELLDSSPDEAVNGLLEEFEKYAEAGLLGEDNRSISVLETLLGHFIAHEDRRAFEIQRRMYEDKIEKYGECPAAWLELQNIGSVHAEFGETDQALQLFEQALEHQTAHFGENHPALEMTKRNIARMKAG